MKNIKGYLANVSHHPGVYQMLGEKNVVLYVGKAKDLKKRLTSYFSSRTKDLKTVSMLKHIKDIDITITRNEIEAVLLECNLIKRHKPRYNVLLRDDKSYPYIVITTEHPFPRIDFYRGSRKKNALYFGPFPTAHAVRETINHLQKIFHIRTCLDTYYKTRNRPCLLYQIGRCEGPCVGLISQEDYAKNIKLAVLFLEGKSDQVIDELQQQMEQASHELNFEHAAYYRDQINRLRQIQQRQYVTVAAGNADIIGLAMQAGVICIHLLCIREGQVLGSRSYFPRVPSHSSIEEVCSSFLAQHYLWDSTHKESIPKQIMLDIALPDKKLLEKVLSEQTKHQVKITRPKQGEKKKWEIMATTSAKQSLAAHLFNQTNISQRIAAFQEVFKLEKKPQRIECFDISHNMGEATSGSCVVFDQTGPVKSDYRHYNITGIKGGDDILAMQQIIERRFKRLQKEAQKLPDVVLIDGGKAQLNVAYQTMNSLMIKNIHLIAISKGPDRKPGFETLHMIGRLPIHLPHDSQALHFIQQIRDEAHRFAITGHRRRRDKVRRHSSLELIEGIGVKRRRELLRYFGGIQGLARASLDEIIKVPGISRSLAERIFATFHDATV